MYEFRDRLFEVLRVREGSFGVGVSAHDSDSEGFLLQVRCYPDVIGVAELATQADVPEELIRVRRSRIRRV
jgi:hypothetical protein